MDDNMKELAGQVDVVFTATPQGLCASLVDEEILSKVKIIDLSADFRIKDVSVYEAVSYTHLDVYKRQGRTLKTSREFGKILAVLENAHEQGRLREELAALGMDGPAVINASGFLERQIQSLSLIHILKTAM